ncbi:hypothetical protein [Duganella sp. S19_KUP01_CR8]|uniref:hypothetical protein n=1 Tax=Duganella sp. S19_KUP01_CR8 TaxID=3025502 RepID=UPI002FCD9903
MAFVFEKIDHTRGAELIQMVRPPIYAFQRWQVIDRERNFVLADLGGEGEYPRGQGDAPDYFNFLWQSMPIAFECYTTEKGVDGTQHINVDIAKITLPENLKNSADEIKRLIPEALTVYWAGRRKKAVSVAVQFPVIQFY